jgi:hypothetical protein
LNDWNPIGVRTKRRPKKRWRDEVINDLKRLKLRRRRRRRRRRRGRRTCLREKRLFTISQYIYIYKLLAQTSFAWCFLVDPNLAGTLRSHTSQYYIRLTFPPSLLFNPLSFTLM